MTTEINIDKSLRKLARLLNIGNKYGWKKKLAEWLKIDNSVITNWNKRGISQDIIDKLNDLGYHQASWFVFKTPFELEMDKRKSENSDNSIIDPDNLVNMKPDDGLTLSEQIDVLKENRQLRSQIQQLSEYLNSMDKGKDERRKCIGDLKKIIRFEEYKDQARNRKNINGE